MSPYEIIDPESRPTSPEWMFAYGLLLAADQGWIDFEVERRSEDNLHVLLHFLKGTRTPVTVAVFDDCDSWDYVDRIVVGGVTQKCNWGREGDAKQPDESFLVRDFTPSGKLKDVVEKCPMVEPT